MNTLSRTLPCVLAAFLLIAAGEPPASDVVAQSGDIRLTAAELKDTLSLLDGPTRAQVTANIQTLSNFARVRLLHKAVIAEAKAKGWDTQPDVVRKVNEARDAVIQQTYLMSLVPPDPMFPSEAEVTTAYDNNKSRLMAPRRFHLERIVLAVKPDAAPQEVEEIHKKALDLRAQAVRPKADFAELARLNSQEQQTAEKGGDAGWLPEPNMIPAERDAVVTMAENDISQPVRTPDGWHILKLLQTKPAGQVPLLEAKPQIVQLLRDARTQRLMQGHLDELVKTQPIQVNEIDLMTLVGTDK